MSDSSRLSPEHEAYIERRQRNPLNGPWLGMIVAYILSWVYVISYTSAFGRILLVCLLLTVPFAVFLVWYGRRHSR